MKIATAHLKSVSTYSQSRYHATEKEPKETADAYERRTWRNKCHVNSAGNVFIPPMAFKQSIDAAAKFSSRQIPGKGKATYTKHFVAGVLVMNPLVLPLTVDDVIMRTGIMNSDGVRGSGKRVIRYFPDIPQWEGTVEYHVFDDNITEEVFEETLADSGRFIGIGVFRPQNGGYYGRFDVTRIDWAK